MNTAQNFRIENIQRATVNGRAAKIFTAYHKVGDAFVRHGQLSAPAKTANRNLWMAAADALTDEQVKAMDSTMAPL